MQRPGEGSWDVVVVGSGNAAMSAGLAALERGASVLMIEKAERDLAGGNTAYTAGAMRFVYEGNDDLMPAAWSIPRIHACPAPISAPTRREKFEEDLLGFNDGRPLSREQRILIDESGAALRWLCDAGREVRADLFPPILREGRALRLLGRPDARHP